jgi:hypothetical protein
LGAWGAGVAMAAFETDVEVDDDSDEAEREIIRSGWDSRNTRRVLSMVTLTIETDPKMETPCIAEKGNTIVPDTSSYDVNKHDTSEKPFKGPLESMFSVELPLLCRTSTLQTRLKSLSLLLSNWPKIMLTLKCTLPT